MICGDSMVLGRVWVVVDHHHEVKFRNVLMEPIFIYLVESLFFLIFPVFFDFSLHSKISVNLPELWKWNGTWNRIFRGSTYNPIYDGSNIYPGGRRSPASWIDILGNLWIFGGSGTSNTNPSFSAWGILFAQENF